jgi:anti-repressor protein
LNELLTINYEADKPTVSARELHEGLEIETRFNDWFPRMCEYGFDEGRDFYSKMSKTSDAGGRPSTDYEITVDMAKEICMLQRTEQGKKYRTYFIELEKAWNTPEQVFARALKMADKVIEQKDKLITELKPKAEFYDDVTGSKDAVPMDRVAKVIDKGIGRNKLFELLREKKILDNDNVPYQAYVDRGYFRVIEQKYTKPNGEKHINYKTLVYQKGIDYIRKLIA